MSEGSLFWSEEARDQLVARLAFHGVRKVVVRFSGSGDSGQIDEVLFEGVDSAQQKALDQDAIPWEETSAEHINGEWVHSTSIVPLGLRVIIERLCDACSSLAGVDWRNNDGGQGDFTIDLQDLHNGQPLIQYFVQQNVVQTEDYLFDYSEGQDDPLYPEDRASND